MRLSRTKVQARTLTKGFFEVIYELLNRSVCFFIFIVIEDE